MTEREGRANDSKGVDADPKFRAGVPMENPGHVLNLGHGVPPETYPDVLTRVVTLIHSISPE